MGSRRLAVTGLTTLCVLAGALLFSCASALALISHEYLSQLTGFQNPVALAVDSHSDLYVVDESGKTVSRFNSSHAPLPFSASEAYIEGNKLTGTPTGPGGAVVPFADPTDIALDETTGEIYVVDRIAEAVDIFSSSGEYLSQLTGTPEGPFPGWVWRVAIDQSTGTVYLFVAGDLLLFDSSNKYISRFESAVPEEYEAYDGEFGDVEVDEHTGNVYIDHDNFSKSARVRVYSASEVASGLGESLVQPEFLGSGTPSGSFGALEEFSRLGLDQATGQLFVVDGGDHVVDELANSAEEVYEGRLAGTPAGPFTNPQAVAADPSSGDVYVADASGVVDVFGPDMQSVPIVEDQTFTSTTSDSVKLSALLSAGTNPATYHFEYGIVGSDQSSTQSSSIKGNHYESVEVGGLTPDTEYHFRLVAENNIGVSTDAKVAFRTLPSPPQTLPDGRVFEMVTPIDKEDAEVYIPSDLADIEDEATGYATDSANEVATNGDAVVYQGDPTHNGGGESSGNGLGSAYLATRSPTGGWSQVSIQPPGRRSTHYQGFSSDLSIGVLASATEDIQYEEHQLPGPEAPRSYCDGGEGLGRKCDRGDLYKHNLSEEDYQPLFTATPERTPGGFSHVIPQESSPARETNGAPVYAGGSSDMSQLLFEANDALLEGKGNLENELDADVNGEIAEGRINNGYLYDWSMGGPSLVDVSPEGRVVRAASFGAPHAQGVQNEVNAPDLSHVISTDGSRVFWTALEGQAPKALYVRENATKPQSPLNPQNECTILTDACTVQLDKTVEGGGARFWTASSDGSKAFFTSKKGELYEYEVNPTVGQPGALAILTPGVEVQGVVGASGDGNYIYYVDGAYELLMLHYGTGGWEAPVLIATLSSHDGSGVEPFASSYQGVVGRQFGDWVPDLGTRTAEVTADGRGLVFLSNQSLKAQGFPGGYRNDGQEEVYVFDAASRSLYCASCKQSGEPGSSGVLPVSFNDSYMPTLISEDGNRVFFDSESALVSKDTNDVLDVYEWEKEGTGSCGVGDGANGGCVYLLSGGSSGEPSYLLGASLNGNDVFVITRARLTAEAQDELFKVFDARVEGVIPLTPPQCTGTGCQGVPAAAPTFATPSSVTYNGIGNFSPPGPVTVVKAKAKSLTRAQKLSEALTACHRKPKKRRVACEAQARKGYGSQSKAKRSSGSKKGRK